MVEHTRDLVPEPLTFDYFLQKIAAGWQLVAIEWQRTAKLEEAEPFRTSQEQAGDWIEEIPYGLRVADDGRHLEPNVSETRVLLLFMEGIVSDQRLNFIADNLNRLGLRTRDGRKWSSPALFDLLPRLIEAGPKLLKTGEWVQRRTRLLKVK